MGEVTESPRRAGQQKVLWLCKGLGLGGAERIIALLGKEFEGRVCDIQVAYVLPHKDAFVSEIERSGHKVICLTNPGDRWPVWWLRLWRLIRRERFDIVHTHSPLPAAVARLCPVRGVRFVHTEHSAWPRYQPLTKLANSVTYARNTDVIGVSDAVVASIRRPHWVAPRAWPRIQRLYHGIDSESVSEASGASRANARAELDVDGELVVGTVASLTPKKNLAALIHSFGTLIAEGYDARLVVLGDGPLRRELTELAERLLPPGTFQFMGARADAQQLLAAFDMFVLPSAEEGLGLALIEALAAGVPGVATAVGGIPEVLAAGGGILVEPGSQTELDEAVLRLASERAFRLEMGSAGRQSAARFEISAAATATAELYSQGK